MKKTIMHTVVDGYDIVLGFGEAPVDPVATSIKVAPLVQNLAEVQQVAQLNQQIADLRTAARNEFAATFGHLPDSLASLNEAHAWNEINRVCQVKVEAIHDQIIPLNQIVASKTLQLQNENPVYATPGGYEDLIDADQAEKLSAVWLTLEGKEKQLVLDGTVIDDQRNVKFWTKSSGTWTSSTVTKLGDAVPSGSVRESALTLDQWAEINVQMETTRVSGLSEAQKLTEAQNAQQVAKNAVTVVQTEVTAGISTQAELDEAVTKYKATLAGINKKYSVNLS